MGRAVAGIFICMCATRDEVMIQSAVISSRVITVFAALLLANAVAWCWAIAAFHGYPILLGTALLAYSFGLRHAVDADHIAAIDNVARKLIQSGRNPDYTGLYFSLGHSTIVVLASLGIALGAGALSAHFPQLKTAGGLIGTSVSALFLFAIAIANLFILGGVYRAFCRVKRSGQFRETDLQMLSRSEERRVGKAWIAQR